MALKGKPYCLVCAAANRELSSSASLLPPSSHTSTVTQGSPPPSTLVGVGTRTLRGWESDDIPVPLPVVQAALFATLVDCESDGSILDLTRQ